MAGAKHFKELIAWQLADQLRVEIFKFTSRPAFTRELKLRSQTEDAANSVCRNIGEGFGGSHAEFARFLRISRRSMNELQDAFRSAELKNYVTDADLAAARQLMRRLYPAISRLIAYLDFDARPAEAQETEEFQARRINTACTYLFAPLAPLAPLAPFAPLAPLAPYSTFATFAPSEISRGTRLL